MPKLLFIDDDPIMRKLCKAYFTAKGHRIEVAGDGKEGLEKFSKDKYDLVITDLMMPNVHGFEVIDAIKKSKRGESTPVLLLTSDAKEPSLQRYDRQYAQDDTLTKPFDIPVLEKRINQLLQEYKDRTAE